MFRKQISSRHPISEKEEESSCLFDDTSRAFERLTYMRQSTNGTISSSQDKPSISAKMKSSDHKSSNAKGSQIKIRAGEKLSDFGARVDQALPIADLVRKGNKRSKTHDRCQDIKTEKKKWPIAYMTGSKKLSGNVPSEDVRYSSSDLDTEVRMSDGNTFEMMNYAEKKRRSRRARNSNLEDPWAVLKTKRYKPSGLHDVAQAPPELKSLKWTKRLNGSSGVGSCTKISPRRREDLERVRKSVIQNYRRTMAERRSTMSQI